MRRLPAVTLLLAACAGGSGGSGQTPAAPLAADQLARLLPGRFDSAALASADSAYRALQLTACRVSAPELGANVFYVEQAQMEELDRPHRQQLQVVEPRVPSTTLAAIRVFELKVPDHAVGLCARPGTAAYSRSDVQEKTGCTVTLLWSGTSFHGETSGTACPSTVRGARFATSEVWLNEAELRIWDRGFDAAGKQVWGPGKGPYVFRRRAPAP
jgi:CpeT protein